MFFAGRFTLSQSSPPVRNATYLRTFFLEFIYVFREILSTSMFFCCSIYIETAQNSREECNEFADLLFWRLSLCLSRDSLSCDTRSLDLCILFNFIFLLPLIHSAPFLRAFHTFYFTSFFFLMYITKGNIFHIPGDAVARNLIIVFNFSSRRPHLNNIFLSNVYSFDTIFQMALSLLTLLRHSTPLIMRSSCVRCHTWVSIRQL